MAYKLVVDINKPMGACCTSTERTTMSGRVCAVFVAVMFAMLVPAFAQTESAVAATAAINCNHTVIATAKRSLSSVHITKLQKHCKQYHKVLTTVSFFKKHRELTAPQYKKCWSVPDAQLRHTACKSRAIVRKKQAALRWLSGRITTLVSPVYGGYPPYQHFSTCTAAVDYLFAGRKDHDRAIYVVRRESTDIPSATNGSYFGCAQESRGMQARYLKGAWNDAYWNVLVLLEVADAGGWCNWDIVNYCQPGGDW